MKAVTTRAGLALPVLGLGTWRMGERADREAGEIAALQAGIDLGVSLIDTAEMYADGGAERVVGHAVRGRRDDVTIVSKVLPGNASRDETILAAERSLANLRTDRIDLYLLHWPGPHAVGDTVEAFEELRAAGKILHWGVSNFDVDGMESFDRLSSPSPMAVNQVLYNPSRRGIESNVLPWCRERDVAIMAYSPLEQGRLRSGGALARIANRHGCTAAQVALAWSVREPGVVTIPKASDPAHVRDNLAALDLVLTAEDLAEIDEAYPRPHGDPPLETL